MLARIESKEISDRKKIRYIALLISCMLERCS